MLQTRVVGSACPALCPVRAALQRGYEPATQTPSVLIVGARGWLPWTPGCLLQGSGPAWSWESLLAIALVETGQKMVMQQSGYPSIPSGQCVVTSLCDLCLPQGYGVAYLVLVNPRVPQKGVLGEFRGWM